MATNPKTVPIANKVDATQLQTLAGGGSITKGGDTYTADERALYLTEETIDTTPTANSDNLVTSGGVYNALPTVNNPTITVTQGGVTKGSFTLNQSSAQTIALDAGGGGSSTDVQINSTSITSGGVANIQTKGTYNASTNKIATESDLPPAVTITTTSGSESVSDGTNTLNFGANAFNSTTIPTTTDSVTQDNTAALTSGGAYTALQGKLDKVSTTTTNPQAYVKTSDGSQTMTDLVAGVATPNTIPYRDGNGRIQSANPLATNDVIPKGYGDDTYATKTLSNVTYPANTAGTTTTGSGDRVIETYISIDGHSWYRKWASGWKECGIIASTTSGWAYYDRGLPLTFTSTSSMYVTVTYIGGGSPNDPSQNNSETLGVKTYTTSTVNIALKSGANKNVYVCGY